MSKLPGQQTSLLVEVAVCVRLHRDPTRDIVAAAKHVGYHANVKYPTQLLPRQRFPADHKGDPSQFVSFSDPSWREVFSQAEVSFGMPHDSPDGLRSLCQGAPRLRWVQATAAGAGEQVAAAGASVNEIRVTSAAGLHATTLAEFAVFGLLALSKDVMTLVRASERHEWLPRWPMRTLKGKRVLIVGLGGVGSEVARLVSAFGATVLGVRRRPLPGPYVDHMLTIDELDEPLSTIDAVVLAVPGTPSTLRLFDARRLSLLPSHALVVNVGRGSALDTTALVQALDSGLLGGAVLDVSEVEPLPSDSPLWDRDDVLISPHTAALSTDEDERLIDLFCQNLRRYLANEELTNLVDTISGY